MLLLIHVLLHTMQPHWRLDQMYSLVDRSVKKLIHADLVLFS